MAGSVVTTSDMGLDEGSSEVRYRVVLEGGYLGYPHRSRSSAYASADLQLEMLRSNLRPVGWKRPIGVVRVIPTEVPLAHRLRAHQIRRNCLESAWP